MANMSKNPATGVWELTQVISEAGSKVATLNTENTFVDGDIEITISTPSGALGSGTGSVEASSDVGLLGTSSSTQPVSGHYVKVEGEANVAVSTGGFIAQGEDVDVNIADVYYPVAEAAFSTSGASVVSTAEGYVASGETVGTVASGVMAVTGGALSAGAGSTALASDGLSDGSSIDSTKKIALTEVNASGYYELEASGSGSVNMGAVYTQQTTAGYMSADSNPVQKIAADSETSNTATKKYYVKQSTLSASSVTPSTSQQTVTISDGYSHENRTVTILPMTGGTASSSTDESGMSSYFNAGTAQDHDVSITPQYSIDTAGFFDATANPVDGTPAYYSIKEQTVTETDTTVSGTSATRGTRTESAGWKDSSETLSVATFGVSAASGKQASEYVDISGTTAAPVLVSGGYLYINKGWTDDVKISTAKLVPDGASVDLADTHILQGYSAYDNDGVLITGSIPTYAGEYTVT